MQKFPRVLIVCLCAFLVLQGCAPARTPMPLPTPIPTPTPIIIAWREPDPDAWLTEAKGRVEVREAGEKEFQRVSVGHGLFNGDVIKTYEESAATFVCTDFSLEESIGSSSEITITCPARTFTLDDAWKPTLSTNLVRTSSGMPIKIGPPAYVTGDPDLLKREIMQLSLDEPSTRLLLANLYLGKGLWNDAIDEFEYLANSSPQPLFYQKLGDLYLLTEPPQYDKSEKLLMEALHLASEMGDKERIASADFGLGWFYFVRGDHSKATQYLRDSYDLYKELGLIEDADTVWSTMIKFNLEAP